DPLAPVSVSFYQVTADGALLAQSVNVTRSADVACTWPPSTGALQGQPVTDIFASPTDPALVLATVALTNGSAVVASHDGGKTFDRTHLYEADVLTGVEISRSDPAVVYAGSASQSGTTLKLAVSTRSGAPGSWSERPIAAPAGTLPRILAVDPADKGTVYLRLITGSTSDVIAVTHDGGQTFETPD